MRLQKISWLEVFLLLLAPVSYWILTAIVNMLFYGGGMIFGMAPLTVFGIILALLGLALPVLGRIYRRNNRFWDRIQDLTFGTIYLMIGIVFFFQGWRVDTILASIYFLLIQVTIYWITKDIFQRS